MRLVTFRPDDGRARAGVLFGDAVIDLEAGAPLVFEEAERLRWDLLSLLRGEDDIGIESAESVALAVADQLGAGIGPSEEAAPGDSQRDGAPLGGLSIGGAEMLRPLDAVRLLAPLPRPASLRLFSSFEGQAEARYQGFGGVPGAWYEGPAFVFGNHAAVLGPGGALAMPATRALDYELQLACVIGRAGRDIAAEDAADYIAGYTILNGWVARDVERAEIALGYGAKSRDFAVSLGPWLVTPDEIEEQALPDGRHNLAMVARVNGVERSRGNARDSFYTIGDLIAAASADVTLMPGDVIATGAVGGGSLLSLAGGGGPWLERGDVVELVVRGLGTLSNEVV
jgi:fumarylacetoacetate (FAA) hydrolase